MGPSLHDSSRHSPEPVPHTLRVFLFAVDFSHFAEIFAQQLTAILLIVEQEIF